MICLVRFAVRHIRSDQNLLTPQNLFDPSQRQIFGVQQVPDVVLDRLALATVIRECLVVDAAHHLQ